MLWIAVKVLRDASDPPDASPSPKRFVQAIWYIVAADLTMSTDNILAIAGASHGSFGLILFGLALSIPFVVLSSNLLADMMDRYPWTIYLGAAVLGRVGGEMILNDPSIVHAAHPGPLLRYAAEAGLAAGPVRLRLGAGRTMSGILTSSTQPCALSICFAFLSFLAAGPAHAQTVTWSEHIAPIIYNNCTSCHRPGQVSALSLMSYDDVRRRGSLVAQTVQTRYMPPWKPEPGWVAYRDERRLTPEQIALISKWVEDGMPRGDSSKEPQLPAFVRRLAARQARPGAEMGRDCGARGRSGHLPQFRAADRTHGRQVGEGDRAEAFGARRGASCAVRVRQNGSGAGRGADDQ